MSSFFGNIIIAFRSVSISSTTLNAFNNTTTASITATASSVREAYTYLWIQSGTPCTINSSTNDTTTFTGSGVTGTTNVYCNIRDILTGNTRNTDSCTITWTSPPSGSIIQNTPRTRRRVPCTAFLSGATATGYSWLRQSGQPCTFSTPTLQNTNVTEIGVPNNTTTIQCTISYSGGSVVPTSVIQWGIL